MSQQSRVTIVAELQDKLTGPARKVKASAEDIGRAVEDSGKRSEKAHAGAGKAAEKQAKDTRAASAKIDKAMADAAKASADMEKALNRAGVKWDGTLDGIVRDTRQGSDRIDQALTRAGVQGGQRMIGNLKSSGKRFVQEAEDIGKKAGDRIAQGIQAGLSAIDSSGLAAGGGALGAAGGVLGALERDRAVRRAAAAGGTDPAALEAMSSSVYGSGLGDSYEGVLATTTSLLAVVDLEPGSKEAEALLKGQQSITDAYQLDPAQLSAVMLIGMEVDGKTAGEMQDIISATLKATKPAARDEVMEALQEYAPVLSGAGWTTEDLAAVLSNSSDMGPMAVDKTGDALKEGVIRLTTGEKAAMEAVSGIGMNAADTRGRILAGDETVWQDINSNLLAVEDPVARAQATMELYGAPMEDLGPGQIDKYLKAWNEIDGIDAAGSTSELTEALTSGEGADATQMMRALSGAFIDVGDAVAPILTPVFSLVSLLAKPVAAAASGLTLYGILQRIPGTSDLGKKAVSGLWGLLKAHPLLRIATGAFAAVKGLEWLYENVGWVRTAFDGLGDGVRAVLGFFDDLGAKIDALVEDKFPRLHAAAEAAMSYGSGAGEDGQGLTVSDVVLGGGAMIGEAAHLPDIGGNRDERIARLKGEGVPAHADGGFTRGDGIYRAGERGREFIVPASATNSLESSAPGALATMANTGQLPGGAAVVHQNTFHLAPGVSPRDADAFAAQWEAKMEAYNRRQGHTYGTMSRRGGRP